MKKFCNLKAIQCPLNLMPRRNMSTELCHTFGFHAGSPVCMQPELTWQYILLLAGFLYQPFRQCCLFPVGNHPANNGPAQNTHDVIQIKICPFDLAFQLRNIPRPDLIRFGCQQFGYFMLRTINLPSVIRNRTMGFVKKPLHSHD